MYLPGRLDSVYGSTFAMTAIAEKGYLDVRVEVATPGGHSSIPPPHTVKDIQQMAESHL